MIFKFFFRTINEEPEKRDNEYERSYLNLINKYLVFLFLLFLFYSVFIVIFFGDAVISTFLTVITFFWLFLMAIKSKTARYRKILKTSVIFVFVLLIFIVSFFHIYTFKNAGVEYFYFSLLFATPFFFNYREESFMILIIALVISLNFIGCLYFDFNFLPKSRFFEAGDFKTVKLLNILFSVGSFLMDISFITQKDDLIYGLIEDTRIKNSTIENLQKTNTGLLKQQMLINHLTEENIREIYQLAVNNSPFFYDKFQVFFPHFIPEILIINPNLIHSELYFCALMKIDFDTKKIAQCTNSSIRAVESKKYRIRKKLNIPSEMNINSFILKI
ncbi:helix-turn-helix transcriptional regulator [Chryseobacterium herbae]|uniref:Two component regulator three Y domain-containing protein n=1 Tax=Chryseobacterium herbae TaxID=2976476 RepID=A0ABT2IWR2_9FLAO|nr:Two component regulator three Y domain-containing protein [Chryseobacterium sp. pc1-10]MCT2563222.1 Two component regulator three Y domain-containing protein [Chryseobacterium sp. pc1-10]